MLPRPESEETEPALEQMSTMAEMSIVSSSSVARALSVEGLVGSVEGRAGSSEGRGGSFDKYRQGVLFQGYV